MIDQNMNDFLFNAEKRESTVEFVLNRIKEALITDKLAPGDKLPSEHELSSQLSISRGSVREAMKILSSMGIVDIRRGSGTYITGSDFKVASDPLLFSLILSKANMQEFVELRELMECSIVKLIIKNATPEDYEGIEHTIHRMEEQMDQKEEDLPGTLAKLDIAFHEALGRATKNILIEKIYSFVMGFFEPSIQLTHKKQKKGLQALQLHKNIHRALVEKNIEKAIEAVELSIEAWKTLSLKGEFNNQT